MGPCIIDFGLKGAVAFFQFRKMGLDGHVVEFSSASWSLTLFIIHPNARISKPNFKVQSSNPRCA
jgi:hypothetical protein